MTPKKKSRHFIIPASYFKNKIVEEKIDVPNKVDETVEGKRETQQIVEKAVIAEPIPKPIIKPSGRRRQSALSLSSIKRVKEEEQALKHEQINEEDLSNMPKDAFTHEQFFNVWDTYINTLHQEGEKIFASILKADRPVIKQQNICVTYPNQMMKAELLKVKPKALRHLRKALNNYAIDFEVTVNEANEKKFAYTPQEKYELLKEKNQHIELLRRTFKLDL